MDGERLTTFENSCLRKKIHATREEAQHAASELFVRTGEIVYPYQCLYFEHFHNGHAKTEPITAVPGDYEPIEPSDATRRRHEAIRQKNRLGKQMRAFTKLAASPSVDTIHEIYAIGGELLESSDLQPGKRTFVGNTIKGLLKKFPPALPIAPTEPLEK